MQMQRGQNGIIATVDAAFTMCSRQAGKGGRERMGKKKGSWQACLHMQRHTRGDGDHAQS